MKDPDKVYGLHCNVYRNARGGDCSNGGPSSKVDDFTVVGVVRTREQRQAKTYEPLPRGSQVFSPSESSPAAVLVLSNLQGGPPHLVPLEIYESGKWAMFGGNLADYSDGRWCDLVASFQPKAKELGLYLSSSVDIHDRIEN